MKYTKPAISFDQQIESLERRGLTFLDKTNAKAILSSVSYYRFRAYTYPFQDNIDPSHPFIQKIDFETIYELYVFDRKLRFLVFNAIERIEIALRTQIIYHFSRAHGSHWQLDPTLFRDTARFVKHLESLTKEIDRSDETFIKHYKKKYTSPSQPPCWMSLEVASMGTLSKFYQNLKRSKAKQAVAHHFGLPKVEILENWMFCISHVRNICAHHGRLWNRRLTSLPKLSYNTTGAFYSRDELKGIYPNKIFASLSCIHYMLNQIEKSNEFGGKLKSLVSQCPLNQEKEMGFIKGWESHNFWKS